MPSEKPSGCELMSRMFEDLYSQGITRGRIKWAYVFKQIVHAFPRESVSEIIRDAVAKADASENHLQELAQIINQKETSYENCRFFGMLLMHYLLAKGIRSKIEIISGDSYVQIENGELLNPQEEWNDFLRNKIAN